MRRILSILMLLVLGLGPAVPMEALASGRASGWTGKVDESRLPACCRRHGKHHCAMGSATSQSDAIQSSDEVTVSAQDSCPFSPRALASTVPSAAALIQAAADAIAYPAGLRAPHAHTAAAQLNDRRSWPKRGPPTAQSL